MDVLERLRRISSAGVEPWPASRFIYAANEGRQRWKDAEGLFGIQYPMFADAVELIAPSFSLSPAEEAVVATTDVPGGRNTGRFIVASFVRWERCPETAGL